MLTAFFLPVTIINIPFAIFLFYDSLCSIIFHFHCIVVSYCLKFDFLLSFCPNLLLPLLFFISFPADTLLLLLLETLFSYFFSRVCMLRVLSWSYSLFNTVVSTFCSLVTFIAIPFLFLFLSKNDIFLLSIFAWPSLFPPGFAGYELLVIFLAARKGTCFSYWNWSINFNISFIDLCSSPLIKQLLATLFSILCIYPLKFSAIYCFSFFYIPIWKWHFPIIHFCMALLIFSRFCLLRASAYFFLAAAKGT